MTVIRHKGVLARGRAPVIAPCWEGLFPVAAARERSVRAFRSCVSASLPWSLCDSYGRNRRAIDLCPDMLDVSAGGGRAHR